MPIFKKGYMANTETRKGFSFNNPDIDSDFLAPKWGLLVTADELRFDELYGNPLIAEADSQSITDDQLNDYNRIALRYLEVELNIDILPRLIRYQNLINETGEEIPRDIDDGDFTSKMSRKQLTEMYIKEPGYPYRVVAARRECFIKLRRRPVRDVLTAKLVDPYFSSTIIDLMPYRYVKKGYSGTCFFKPRQLTARTNIYQNIWQNYIFSPYSTDRQNIFLIDYTTGYENCQDVPDEFRYITQKIAALTLMAKFGLGKIAGIASRSVSLNSVSESISTTQSATSSYFGSTILQYQKEIKQWFAQNRSKYSRTIIGNL
jgi:hypothetical protein